MNLLFWSFVACSLAQLLVDQCDGVGDRSGRTLSRSRSSSRDRVSSKNCKVRAKKKLVTDELILVQMIHRHGDRNIRVNYETDPYGDKDQHYPEGLSQLTPTGRIQQYKFGQYIGSRYDDFLKRTGGLRKSNVYCRSTDVPRCIESGKELLRGLCEPKDPPQIVVDIPKKEADDHILSQRRKCERQKEEMKYVKQILMKDINEKYAEYYKKLTKLTGNNIQSVCDVLDIYHNIFCHVEHRKPVPEWAKDYYSEMEGIGLECFKMHVKTKTLLRLGPGFLMKEILQICQNKINHKLNPNVSLYIYCAHDTTIVGLLSALKLFDPPHFPDYTACLFFELYRSPDNSYYIKLFYRRYRNETELEPLVIPNCGIKCPLNEWYNLYGDILPGEFEDECRSNKKYYQQLGVNL